MRKGQILAKFLVFLRKNGKTLATLSDPEYEAYWKKYRESLKK